MPETQPDLREALAPERVKRNLRRHPGWCGAITDACTLIDALQAENAALRAVNAELGTGDWTDVRQLEAEARISALQAEVERLQKVEGERDAAVERARLLRHVIDMAKADLAFMAADEADGSATDKTRRTRIGMIRDSLNGVGSAEARAALSDEPPFIDHEPSLTETKEGSDDAR